MYECFTLCWLGSLGCRSPAWVLFTALSAHEVSLPGLEQGQSSSVSLLLSQALSRLRQPWGYCRPSQGLNGCPPYLLTLQSFIGLTASPPAKRVQLSVSFFSLMWGREVRNCMQWVKLLMRAQTHRRKGSIILCTCHHKVGKNDVYNLYLVFCLGCKWFLRFKKFNQ